MPRWTPAQLKRAAAKRAAKAAKAPGMPRAPRAARASSKTKFMPPALLQVGDVWLNPANVRALETAEDGTCRIFTDTLVMAASVPAHMAAEAIITNTPLFMPSPEVVPVGEQNEADQASYTMRDAAE